MARRAEASERTTNRRSRIDERRISTQKDTELSVSPDDPESRLTLRDEQRLFTRRRIAEAALKVFGEKGYIATTVEDIVAAARTSRATFYLHFASKLAVLRFVGVDLGQWAQATLRQMDVAGPVPRTLVEQVVTEGFTHWRENANLLSAGLQAEAVEAGMASTALADLTAIINSSFPTYLGQFTGHERELARTELQMLIALTYRYMMYEFVTPPYPEDLSLQIEAMTNILWTAMSARVASLSS